MTSTGSRLAAAAEIAEPLAQAWYGALGVAVHVASEDPEIINQLDASFAELRVAAGRSDAPRAFVRRLSSPSGGYEVISPDGVGRRWETVEHAALDARQHVVDSFVTGLHRVGLLGVHAAAVADGDQGLLVAGGSGSGKTTVALALAAMGLALLSDEMAILDPTRRLLHPYRRHVHVRPGTPELIDGLQHVAQRPRVDLGGGIAWSVSRGDVGVARDSPCRLAGVVLLEVRDPDQPEPRIRELKTGIAAMELLRGTWAASVDFTGTLAAIGDAIEDVPSVSVRPGLPMPTARGIVAWARAIR